MGQLSLRTVSIPLQSILSCTSGRVKYKPAYLFLLISRYGKYTWKQIQYCVAVCNGQGIEIKTQQNVNM